jgi:small-conductance mechanosensitive channel
LNILNTTLFDNAIGQWLLALLVMLLLTGALTMTRGLMARRLSRVEPEKRGVFENLLLEIVKRTGLIVLIILSVHSASLMVALPPGVSAFIRMIAFIAVIVQLGIWGNYIIADGIRGYFGRSMKDTVTSSGVIVISLIGRTVLWSFILLVILDNVGVNVTALIAGLGVGGIAIGLATQNILSDLFASLSILLDRPFETGHFIIVGEHLGTVESIGLKTTRIRSLSGELLIFGNNDLLQSRIRNFTNFQERRVVFTFGILYSTPAEKLREIPPMVRRIIENIDNARFDRAHFKSFGDFSLIFEVVYYVLSPDFVIYMDIQERINIDIFEAFESKDIQFAFPTRTIHFAGQPQENIAQSPVGR